MWERGRGGGGGIEVEVAVLSSSSAAAQEDGLAASRVWGHSLKLIIIFHCILIRKVKVSFRLSH